jgi:hypothetical protein
MSFSLRQRYLSRRQGYRMVDRHELEGDASCTLWLASGASPGQLLEPRPGLCSHRRGLCQWRIGGARTEAATSSTAIPSFFVVKKPHHASDFDLHQGWLLPFSNQRASLICILVYCARLHARLILRSIIAYNRYIVDKHSCFYIYNKRSGLKVVETINNINT